MGFKHVIFASILIGVLAYSVVLSTQKILPHIAETKRSFTQAKFQNEMEDRIEGNIANMLSMLVGQSKFFVSVSSDVDEAKAKTEKITYTPVTVTENTEEKYQGNAASTLQGSAASSRPSSDEIRNKLAEMQLTDTRMPIFFPELIPDSKISKSITESLPGFPLSATKSASTSDLSPTIAATASPNEKIASANQKNEQKTENSLSKLTAKEIVQFNQTKSVSQSADHQLRRVYVSIMIDEDRFKMAKISQESLSTLIKTVSGFDENRGDVLTLTIIPFPSNGLTWESFWFNIGPSLERGVHYLAKIKWVLLAMLSIVSALIMLIYVVNFLKASKMRHDLAQKEIHVQAEQEMEKQKRDKLNKTEQKREGIIELAKGKPEEFARAIVNWIEKST